MSAPALPTTAGQARAMRDAFDRSFAEPVLNHAPAFDSYFEISVGGTRYAVPLVDVAGLFSRTAITRLPTAHPALLGLASFRGAIAPVYDLHVLLGHKRAEKPGWLALAAETPVAFAFEHFEGNLRINRAEPSETETKDGRTTPATITAGDRAFRVVPLPALLEKITGKSAV
jgi:hypothetical protein